MPEIMSDPTPDEEKEDQEEGISQEERQEIIANFERRIESGEWSDQSFHNLVKTELYPLIGEDALGVGEFTRLVQKWAAKNHPHDWVARDTVFPEPSKN